MSYEQWTVAQSSKLIAQSSKLTALGETRKVWDRMREDPTPGMKELIAAEPNKLAEQ